MKVLDRDKDAYDDGRRAALSGQSLTQYRTLYRRNADLWTQFQLGYLDTLRDMRRAQAHREAKHG